MRGKSVYLRENERQLIAQAIRCYIDMMEDGEETYHILQKELDNGLRTGMNKLLKEVVKK